jgi:subtilisin-like proprotein convertase family protein
VKYYTMRTRILLLALAALLALPTAQLASPAEARNRPRTVTRTYRNTERIDVPIAANSPVSASVYPSRIAVSGLKGKIRDVNLRLNRLSHTNAEEVQVLLVAPSGQTAMVMAYVGGGFSASDVTVTIDDEAGAPLPDDEALQSGAFQPLNGDGGQIVFNAPAPSASANVDLSVFDGASPTGTWRLYVQDGSGKLNSGSFTEGWELKITARVKANKKKR